MVRLIFKDKKGANWFKQFLLLKDRMRLSTRETIKLLYLMKIKKKAILIQPVKEELPLDVHLDDTYHLLKYFFNISYHQMTTVLFNLNVEQYQLIITDWIKGYSIYKSRD